VNTWTKCFGSFTPSLGMGNGGEYKDSQLHEQGTYSTAIGNKYAGEWKDGKANGQGIQYNADETVLREGIFENDKLNVSRKLLQL